MSLEDNPASGLGPSQGLREVSDARTFRALGHPVRLALLETLVIEGPLTATEAAEQIGESPTTCSFHLRQLARYGFVEEAGGGKGRARPWRDDACMAIHRAAWVGQVTCRPRVRRRAAVRPSGLRRVSVLPAGGRGNPC